MLLYFGPELLMPLASAAAAALGAILMFWRRFVAGLKAAGRSVLRLVRSDRGPAPSDPGPTRPGRRPRTKPRRTS